MMSDVATNTLVICSLGNITTLLALEAGTIAYSHQMSLHES